jgi:hypothetical protein
MAWSWLYETADGSPAVPPRSQEFPTQSDAETWVGENWRDLLAQGIGAVSLLEEERVAYGPMGLTPA